MPTIKLPNGKDLSFSNKVTGIEVADKISKSLSKQASLIKDEILPYFEKQNAIVLVGMDNGYEGYAQRINRESKRFDLAKFKEVNPKIYAKYLVESKSTEIKVSFKVVDAKK